MRTQIFNRPGVAFITAPSVASSSSSSSRWWSLASLLMYNLKSSLLNHWHTRSKVSPFGIFDAAARMRCIHTRTQWTKSATRSAEPTGQRKKNMFTDWNLVAGILCLRALILQAQTENCSFNKFVNSQPRTQYNFFSVSFLGGIFAEKSKPLRNGQTKRKWSADESPNVLARAPECVRN